MTANAARDASRWSDPERGLCVMTLAGCSPPELLEHAEEEKQRDIEEAARVLYVAATRARDLLVVSTVGDVRYDDRWLSALNPAIFPPADRSFSPETNRPAGCPAFGPDNCLRPSGVLRPKGSVTPGQHQPEAGEHRVVWWDPCVLELGKQEDVGSRLNKLIAADEKGTRSQAGILAHSEWQAKRTSVRDAAGTPSLRVVTATEHALAIAASTDTTDVTGSAAAAEVTVESAGIDFTRPHGKRFGILIHAVLSVVDLDADRGGVEAVAELQGRVLNATEEEVAAARETVLRALAHPLLRRASEAAARGSLRRETPVAIELEDGLLVEGVVDLAFLDESGSWMVVDFKTDFEIGGRIDEYRNQVSLYAKAISRASRLPSRGVLLRV